MNAPVIRHEQRQHQTLTPRLQQAVRLLQLSSLDFALEVNQAMGSNPFLECDEAVGDPGVAVPAAGAEESSALEAPIVATSADGAADAPVDTAWEGDGWAQYGTNQRNSGGDRDFDFSDITPADQSLRDHLLAQSKCLTSSTRDRTLITTLIHGLDDDGFLRMDLGELKVLSGLDPAPDDDEMAIALKLVQSLEPAGVGARDLRECLLLQLREDSDPSKVAVHRLAQRIVTDYLDRLAMRDVAGLARSLGVAEHLVSQAADCIRRLQPRPGWRFGTANTRFVTPDVVVRKVRGTWTVMLNPSVVPKVRLNRMYADLFQNHRDARHSDLAAQLQEARWTVRNVEQRFATILRVAQAIVRHQCHFLDYGELAMKPLGLRQIADELGLHESTVSRVTNNKYMATPLGVFELKYFFSRALATTSGGTCSATAIRGAIKDMIHEENAKDPLSDAHIARLLARQGLQVARRTVTKYRQMMRVPAYEMRRRQA
ncbi:MAG: RNA polymerase factor sigma-54 [Burkholderiaceae bacterium]|nr:RNA polymerase factor sigma-54 [Burkholderiaceae bacterium]